MNLLKMAAVVAVLSVGFASCTGDDDINTTIVSGTQEALDQACADWKLARADWERSEAFIMVMVIVSSCVMQMVWRPFIVITLATLLRSDNGCRQVSRSA